MWLWWFALRVRPPATSFSSLEPALVPVRGGATLTLAGAGIPSGAHMNARLTVEPVAEAAGVAPVVVVVPLDVVSSTSATMLCPLLESGGRPLPPGRYTAKVDVAVDGTTFEPSPVQLTLYGALSAVHLSCCRPLVVAVRARVVAFCLWVRSNLIPFSVCACARPAIRAAFAEAHIGRVQPCVGRASGGTLVSVFSDDATSGFEWFFSTPDTHIRIYNDSIEQARERQCVCGGRGGAPRAAP